MRSSLLAISSALSLAVSAQQAIVTYAGNTGKEVFHDITRLSDGTFVVAGYATDLGWVSASVPRTTLPASGIDDPSGTDRVAMLLHVSSDLQDLLHVVQLPVGAAEDFRFIKQDVLPNATTNNLYVSGNTSGGYFLGRLDNNFINGVPTGFAWVRTVDATGYVKENHPWDVGSDGKVIYITGQSHGYDWAAMHRLDASGVQEVVPDWRVHWKSQGGEWYGTPASTYTDLSDPLDYSGVVFKRGGRCDLRSWTSADYTLVQPDGNGGTKQGKWPLDFMYTTPCDPNNSPVSNGPGYTGYSPGALPIYGPSIVTVDRRDNTFYLGMNLQTVLPGGEPDFEPAVVKFTSTGALAWWSRLYHEIQPNGTLVNSSPDQYVDGIAVDYSQQPGIGNVIINARCHGNNVENFWEGNSIMATPGASGFQNGFTGTSGNIHISWLGKLSCAGGVLKHSTYVAEYVEGSNNYGTPLADPNMANWPNPNSGWPDVNTTRIARASVKATADGSVCIAAVGRRTITTANAYQQMPLPSTGLAGSWNSFVRVYEPDLGLPKYSSLLVGEWDTSTGAGGGNTDLYALWKTADGIVAVGRHQEDTGNPGVAKGNAMPVANVPAWGSTTPQNESAVLAFFKASTLEDPDDGPSVSTGMDQARGAANTLIVYPNPAQEMLSVTLPGLEAGRMRLLDALGRVVRTERTGLQQLRLEVSLADLVAGPYLLQWQAEDGGMFATPILVE